MKIWNARKHGHYTATELYDYVAALAQTPEEATQIAERIIEAFAAAMRAANWPEEIARAQMDRKMSGFAS